MKKLLFVLILVPLISFGQNQKKDTLSILFVGNSFNYFYNLPQVVNAMSAFSDNYYLKTRHSLVGASTLYEHLNEEKGTKTIDILNSESFDYVVLQHHSTAAQRNFENLATPPKVKDSFFPFIKTSKKMIELIKSKNAIPVFMMTWAYRSNPLMIDTISSAYNDMSEQLDVDVVPCGPLFDKARKLRPDLNLFEDNSHPSKNGTYLNGLAFYKYFTNEKTLHIPKRITTTDRNGEKLYLLFISKSNSDFLQNIVDDFDYKTLLN